MRPFLDTLAVLWRLAGDKSLSKKARSVIADDDNEIFVSAVSAWEVSTTHRIGKLPGAGPLVVDFAREVRQQGFTELPITLD